MSKRGYVARSLMISHCCVMKLQNSVQTHEENALRTQGGGYDKLLISGALFALLLIRKRLLCPLAHLEPFLIIMCMKNASNNIVTD